MSHASSSTAWGFLTVLSSDEQGLIGGYLILNQAGRPLEFHCTAPVKPNRAQQILFGPTLEPYLYGEQIGQTLVSKGSATPAVVYTDVPPALAMRDFVDMPVALVLALDQPAALASTADNASAAAGQSQWRVDRSHRLAGAKMFAVGANRLAVTERHRGDEQTIVNHWQSLEPFDLAEPFERIRDAIAEAQRQSRA
ncbi:MAG TPA: hypothetical protein VHY91_22015 [Pirellulales bacterium]|jgi:hypothetical protein|nr:hypothetical protein [Pirellulales bacterium]